MHQNALMLCTSQNKQSKLQSTLTQCVLYVKNYILIHSHDVFLKLWLQQRYYKVKELKRCLNCLHEAHIGSNCRSGICKISKNFYIILYYIAKFGNQSYLMIPTQHLLRTYQRFDSRTRWKNMYSLQQQLFECWTTMDS